MIDKLVYRKERLWPTFGHSQYFPRGTEEDCENVDEDSRSRTNDASCVRLCMLRP